MPKLTETAIRNAKRPQTDYKLYDERGMYLLVKANGAKLWRLKFYLDGKERLLSLGDHRDVSLKEARDARDEKRKLIAKGVDPVALERERDAEKREERLAVFATAAERYYKAKAALWSETHRRDVRRMIDRELVPALGKLPLSSIKTADVRKVIDAIAERKALTYAKDVRMYYRAILHHFNTQRPHDRQVPDASLHVVVPDPPAEKSHAALQPHEIGAFLRAISNGDATPMVRIAVRLLLLTAVRTNELRRARWSEFDIKGKLWRLPRTTMKARREHVVPLSTQTLVLLAQLRTVTGSTDADDLLLPNILDSSQPISENTILAAIKRAGYKRRMTGHGCRSVFSTWAHESAYSSDVIERQLAHAPADKVKAAYLHSEFLAERTRLMQAWADYLDMAERDIVPIGAAA
jgi:integrase